MVATSKETKFSAWTKLLSPPVVLKSRFTPVPRFNMWIECAGVFHMQLSGHHERQIFLPNRQYYYYNNTRNRPVLLSMMTATAVTAGVVFQIRRRGNAAQFERFGDVFLDGILDFVKLLARVEKAAGDGIAQQRIAVFFKIGNFGALRFAALRLFFLKRLALVHQGFILAARAGVGQKGVNPPADG